MSAVDADQLERTMALLRDLPADRLAPASEMIEERLIGQDASVLSPEEPAGLEPALARSKSADIASDEDVVRVLGRLVE